MKLYKRDNKIYVDTSENDSNRYHYRTSVIKQTTSIKLEPEEEIQQINNELALIRKPASDKIEIELTPGWYRYQYEGGWSCLEPFELRKDEAIDSLECYSDLHITISRFFKSVDIYRQHGLLHKRGILLYGPPGTGKTTYIRSALKKLKDSVVGIWIDKNFPCSSMLAAIQKCPYFKVIVLEELIAYVRYDWKALLELLDGELTLDNCLFIATTNFPDQLPSNLIERLSRFDVLVELSALSLNDKVKLTELFLKRKVTTSENELLKNKLTIAELKEICILMIIYDLPMDRAQKKINDQLSLARSKFDVKHADDEYIL